MADAMENQEAPVALKSGWQTSEFWISAAAVIAAVLGAVGVIGIEEQTELVSSIEKIVTGIISMVALVGYQRSRTRLKSEAMASNAEITHPVPPPVTEEKGITE